MSYDSRGAENSFSSTMELDDNYKSWSRAFMMSITGHRKKYLLVEDEPNEKVGKYSTWEEDNSMVSAWLLNSVHP